METMPFTPTGNEGMENIMEINGVTVKRIRFNRATREVFIDYTKMKKKAATKVKK
jgi:hypothetical protein